MNDGGGRILLTRGTAVSYPSVISWDGHGFMTGWGEWLPTRRDWAGG